MIQENMTMKRIVGARYLDVAPFPQEMIPNAFRIQRNWAQKAILPKLDNVNLITMLCHMLKQDINMRIQHFVIWCGSRKLDDYGKSGVSGESGYSGYS